MDHHKLDNLYLMRLFTLIVRLGSFAAAARQLQITAGKVSKDIHFLEQRLQTRLLHRTTRSLTLTDDGELYFQQAERILELNEQLLDSLSQRRHELAGELRITAPELWGELVLTPVLLGFKAKHPQVSIVAEFSNRAVDLLQDGFHIAFRSTRLSSEPILPGNWGRTSRFSALHRLTWHHALLRLNPATCCSMSWSLWRRVTAEMSFGVLNIPQANSSLRFGALWCSTTRKLSMPRFVMGLG